MGAAHLGISQWLAAHPWWAVKIAWISTPVSLFLVGLTIWLIGARSIPAAGFIVPALATNWTTSASKANFIGSFGKDTRTGQVWYFGWIATAAFATAALTILSASRLARDCV
ncbi:MAG: hypothetical protein ACI8TF_000698 [Paracoccaceae bacterium]